ncbi:MAG: zinc-ribbon domain-containing protein, partial [Oscillospiraceae bacterium]|nr:zinc-ribbon domain-containing protein [Oscillospiraceae bacterium]
DEIASFQAKKTLMNSVLTAVEKNGDSSELPNSLKKDVIENVAKTLNALVSFIHDRRSAERMKELLENAVQEKAVQAASMATPAPAPVPAPVPEAPAEEPAANYEAEYRQAEPPHAPAALEEISAPAVDDYYEEEVSETESAEDFAEPDAEYVAEHAAVPEVTAPEVATLEEVTAPAASTEPAPEPAEVKVKFCDQCGARITSPTAKFCAECGNKLM